MTGIASIPKDWTAPLAVPAVKSAQIPAQAPAQAPAASKTTTPAAPAASATVTAVAQQPTLTQLLEEPTSELQVQAEEGNIQASQVLAEEKAQTYTPRGAPAAPAQNGTLSLLG
jgi:hypothetical protein